MGMKMSFQLLIAEPRWELRAIWETAFEDMPGVVVVDGSIHAHRKDIDAELLSCMLAERFGEYPEVGKSHILATHNAHDMSPWVVTTPALPMDWDKTSEETAYYFFTKAFEAIRQF
ncbi:MAG: hypothetical protein ONB06_12265, partial [candidate division KSB1 bacterium]|nr:hypothetical protein [candidate division KSB1 bacterium]